MSVPAPTTRRGLVDVHAHFLTDRYVAEARAAGHEPPDGIAAWPRWDVDTHLRMMDANGIDVSVLSISSPGVHFGDPEAAVALARHVNDAASSICRDHPERFRFFVSLPLPDIATSLRELDRALSLPGAVGVAVLSNHAGHYLGDEELEPLIDELDRRRATAFVHPTSPPAWPSAQPELPRPALEFLFDEARAVIGLALSGSLQRHPDLKLIVPHTGGVLPLLIDRVDLLKLASPHLASAPTTAPALKRIWFDMAGTPVPAALSALTAIVRDEQVLYGSDYCFTPALGVAVQHGSLDAYNGPGISDWRALTTRNARTLLGTALPGGTDARPPLPHRIRQTVFRIVAWTMLIRGRQRRRTSSFTPQNES